MDLEEVKISRKKPVYAVSPALRKYLRHYQRDARMPISYKHLLDFYETLPVMDKNGRDTLWETPIYPPHIQENLYNGLKTIYAQLKASGNTSIVVHKYIDRLEYCPIDNPHLLRMRYGKST